MVGLTTLKNQLRGLRRTLEMSTPPRHFAFVGNPGVGKTLVAQKLADMLYHMGATKSRTLIRVGRDDLVDRKSEARTVFKTRKVMERASGGALLLDEAYTLLPSTARPRGRDHGAAALREIARALPSGNPVVICTGTPVDLQRILSSEIGFKTHFLTHIEFPDLTPEQIARVFFAKLGEKGLVPAEGVTIEYLTQVIATNTKEEYRSGRNGRIAELLLQLVRAEMRKRVVWDDAASRGTLSPLKMLGGTSRMPAFSPEEVFVTVEDVQNAIVHGLS
jgi:ATPase family associated with various cellular activities (AAA)